MSRSPKLLNVLYELATSTAARRDFARDPAAMLAARELDPALTDVVLAADKRGLDLALLRESEGGQR